MVEARGKLVLQGTGEHAPFSQVGPGLHPSSILVVLLRGMRNRDKFHGGLDLHFYIFQDPADLSLLADLIILGYLRCAL
jgi:hypothetical protein